MKTKIDEMLPEFNDLTKQPHILAQMANYAKAHGFTDDEIKDIRDRKQFAILHKAMMFDALAHLHETGKIQGL